MTSSSTPRVKGTDVSEIIGEGSEQELFLDDAEPAIYHDLKGDNWQERFRRKVAPLIARILERPDYADIFALFLLHETDAEREAMLLERGITSADVDEIRAAVGIASERSKRLQRRWFGAIAAVLTGSDTLVGRARGRRRRGTDGVGPFPRRRRSDHRLRRWRRRCEGTPPLVARLSSCETMELISEHSTCFCERQATTGFVSGWRVTRLREWSGPERSGGRSSPRDPARAGHREVDGLGLATAGRT